MPKRVGVYAPIARISTEDILRMGVGAFAARKRGHNAANG